MKREGCNITLSGLINNNQIEHTQRRQIAVDTKAVLTSLLM
jgi:hypothetical protein